jgi:hypothetical protein
MRRRGRRVCARARAAGACADADGVIREAMTEQDVEVVLQRGRERHPMARPRIISDNGPQFIAKDSRSSSDSPA